MKQKIIQQGAEAKILHQKNNIIKHRISKGYRHPDLDKKIIKRRSKSEAKLLNKAASLFHRFWSWIHQQQDRRQSSRSTPNKTSLRSKTFLNLEICLANNNKKLQI
jgi:hypothetical protein